jgi:NMD protein affecting ribosome stability and mRNA decay
MLKGLFKKQNPASSVKCVKCGKKYATGEDKMCDSCRYMFTIANIVEEKQQS